MKEVKIKFIRHYLLLIFISVLLLFNVKPLQVSSHGGEDHDDSPKQTVAAGTKIITQVVHTGEFEVTLKHSLLEPDTKTSAQIFVTNYKTNTPIENAKLNLTIERNGKNEKEIAAKQTETIGLLTLELPPMPQGIVKFKVQVGVGSKTESASFGTVSVEPHEGVSPTETHNERTLTVFLSFALILIIIVIGLISWFAIRRYRTSKTDQSPKIKNEIVSV